ncbi:helix-turn-helix transcriptional regulator [Allonocardiopsis opalescens]|nr:YafY family protein [Allonocardiopsis opalescens]
MLETSARLLRLLSLLQARRDWPGPELAERLGVSARTIRKDVEKLRALGYPVHAVSGAGGGYRLGAGAELPPLLLDDEEAVAVAVGLRTAAGGTVAGIEETSVRALAKLEQVLPERLRRRVNAVQTHLLPVPLGGPVVDAAALTRIASAARDRHRLRFDYRDHEGAVRTRDVEPYRLVSHGRRWYLVGYDTGRADWRTFRVDRIELRSPDGPRFTPREPPDPDIAGYVARGVDAAPMRYRAAVTVHASAEQLRPWLSAAVQVEAVDERTCLVHAGAESPRLLAAYLAMLDLDFEVDGPPELLDAMAVIERRLRRAARRET